MHRSEQKGKSPRSALVAAGGGTLTARLQIGHGRDSDVCVESDIYFFLMFYFFLVFGAGAAGAGAGLELAAAGLEAEESDDEEDGEEEGAELPPVSALAAALYPSDR